jgi:quinol monooxygenase YgiN
MFVRLTFVKFQPEKLEEVRKLYYDEVIPAMKKQEGLRFVHLLERLEAEGEAISITAWDNKANADAYEGSGLYQELVNKFHPFYTATPELQSYEVTVSSDPILVRIF